MAHLMCHSCLNEIRIWQETIQKLAVLFLSERGSQHQCIQKRVQSKNTRTYSRQQNSRRLLSKSAFSPSKTTRLQKKVWLESPGLDNSRQISTVPSRKAANKVSASLRTMLCMGHCGPCCKQSLRRASPLQSCHNSTAPVLLPSATPCWSRSNADDTRKSRFTVETLAPVRPRGSPAWSSVMLQIASYVATRGSPSCVGAVSCRNDGIRTSNGQCGQGGCAMPHLVGPRSGANVPHL